ncbi:MAG: S8 family serine peptidase, partial [Candidatus Omnitrophota bacterium]
MQQFKGAIIKGIILLTALAIAAFSGTAAFCFVPDDPYYHSSGSWGQPYDDLWALKADKLNCEPAWDISQGEGVVVAIVDSGIDYNHEDLNANIWINENEIPNNGKDDDGNGYIDDIIGWNFIDNNNDVMDTIGHGSHCAGIIAARGDNGKGIIGVAPKAKIMALKAMTGEGESTVDKVVQAIKYAADNGADIINLSWGVPTRWWSPIPSLSDVINYAYAKGCIIVCAAGNNNDDATYYPPANYTNVITVGATTQKNEKCSFSNYGS